MLGCLCVLGSKTGCCGGADTTLACFDSMRDCNRNTSHGPSSAELAAQTELQPTLPTHLPRTDSHAEHSHHWCAVPHSSKDQIGLMACLGLTIYRLRYIHKKAKCPLTPDQKAHRVDFSVVNIILVESESMYTLTMTVLTVAAFLGSNAYYLLGGVVSFPWLLCLTVIKGGCKRFRRYRPRPDAIISTA